MKIHTLIKAWFDFSFESSEVRPIHHSLYFWMLELNNRLVWIEEYDIPTDAAMEVLGVKNYKTYISAFERLEEWGFIKVIQRSKNQYTSNRIALVKNTKALPKALSKALPKAVIKQSQSTAQSIMAEKEEEQTEQTPTITTVDQPQESADDGFDWSQVPADRDLPAFGQVRRHYESELGYSWTEQTRRSCDSLLLRIQRYLKTQRQCSIGEITEDEQYEFYLAMVQSDNWHVKNNLSLSTLDQKFDAIVSQLVLHPEGSKKKKVSINLSKAMEYAR